MEALIAVDPHKASITLAVFDTSKRVPIAEARFATTTEGYRSLKQFVKQWPKRWWAVEGCNGSGRSLAQRLVADDERVVDVPAKLAARVRVFSTGHGRKTDRDDALSIGHAALNAPGLNEVRCDDAVVALKLLCDRRNDLVAARTQIVCRLHVFLVELIPGGAPRALTAKKAAEMLAKVRPRDEVGMVRRQLAMDHLAELRLVDRRLEESERRITAAVASTGSTLLGLYGIGPVLAGRILGEVGHVGRFATKDHFASYSGTAPIDVSSGEQQRHRLSRAGNRQLNHALHMMAVTQIRNRNTAGRAYYERKVAAGKTKKEALRCLKRRLSDVVYRQLVLDLDAASSLTS